MKKTYILLLALLIVIGIIAWHRRSQPIARISEPAKEGTAVVQQQPPGVRTNHRTQPTPSGSVRSSKSAVPADELEFVRRIRIDPDYEWKQPISFYGKVVDESNQPVAGATIHFEWTDLSQTGTSDAVTESDANGLFSLEGKHGKRLCLWASKEGYYTAADARVPCYEYADPADGLFKPDKNNPVILHLRKKGPGTDLITSTFGMSPNFPIHIPRNGTPIKVDLLHRKVGETGQVQISENKPDYKAWKQATNWWFRMEIADGGFAGENEEFPFEAPEDNYDPVVEFRFEKENPNWTTGVKTNFYIKFGNPPRYGRLEIQTGISYGGAILTYAINPNGSRYLEPK